MPPLTPVREIVLVVCTANVCRSPYIQARLTEGVPGLVVRSAGTHAHRGERPDPRLAALLQVGGSVPPNASARPLRAGVIRRAGLILTATHQHRLVVVGRNRGADERTFTVKEFARLLSGRPGPVPEGGLAALTGAAHRDRRRAPAVSGEQSSADDLADPFGGSAEAYRIMFLEVEAALRVIAARLRLLGSAGDRD